MFYPLLNFLQALFLGFWTVVCISSAFVATLFTFSREIALVMARKMYSPPLIWVTQTDFQVEPLPDIDWSKPHIYVMNHTSMMDIVCAFAAIPANLRFVAKASLKWVPFLGWYMWMTKMVFIDRSNRRKAVMSLREAGERIREGANIIVFPEGTRSRDGEIQPFKKGPFVLALEAGVPIVPIAIEGGQKVLPSDGFRIRPGVIRMKVGQPIETANRKGQPREQLLIEVRDAIVALHKQIGGRGGCAQAIAKTGVEGKDE